MNLNPNEVIDGIHEELVRAHNICGTFFNLFDWDIPRSYMLADVDEDYFTQTFGMYLDSIALSISRPLDKATYRSNGGEQHTLSFAFLLTETVISTHPNNAVWRGELAKLKATASKFIEYRHKRAAHSHIPITGKVSDPIPGTDFSSNEISEALGGLAKLLNRIRHDLNLPVESYQKGVRPHSYGDLLLERLEAAKSNPRSRPLAKSEDIAE